MCRRYGKGWAVVSLATVLLAVLLAGLVACGSSETSTGAPATTAAPSATTAAPTTTVAAAPTLLTVSAAASLKVALTEMGKSFDAAHNAKTSFNFDASGTLQKQIEAGAGVDVFASAAMKQMNALVEGGFVDEASVRVFAGNEIVLVVPAKEASPIAGFDDLTKPEVKKVTYGDPAAAPHGVAAEEILNHLGIFDQVKPRVIYAANVSQALEYVINGEVDAGIIFATEAATAGDKVRIVATSQADWHGRIAYPIGVVSAGKVQTVAQAFVDYVMSSEGQAVLHKHGFLPAPAQ